MTSDLITIPPEALKEAAKAAYNKWRDKIRAEERDTMPPDMLDEVAPEWDDLGANQQDWIDQTRAACLAMLKAWPGMEFEPPYKVLAIILPLPKEPSDEG